MTRWPPLWLLPAPQGAQLSQPCSPAGSSQLRDHKPGAGQGAVPCHNPVATPVRRSAAWMTGLRKALCGSWWRPGHTATQPEGFLSLNELSSLQVQLKSTGGSLPIQSDCAGTLTRAPHARAGPSAFIRTHGQ